MQSIETGESNILKCSEQCAGIVKATMERIWQFLAENPFSSIAEEIDFFRNVKPKFERHLIYYLNLYRIQSRLPPGTDQLKLEYLENQLRTLDHWMLEHEGFYEYYRSGSNFLDEFYFTRDRKNIHFSIEVDWVYSDQQLSTGYDYLISRMFACEDLIIFLNRYLEGIKEQQGRRPINGQVKEERRVGFIQTPFRAVEIYIVLKSLIDSGAIVNHNYKSFFELVVPGIANNNEKYFTASSLLKYSDKVTSESRENVKRLLQKMIRNIDNY